MSDKPVRQFKGVWIPKEIWDNDELSWTEKCLLAEINCLDDEANGCTASNDYLGQKFGTSANGLANILTRLRQKGFIETVAFDGRRRAIRVKAALTESLRLDSQTPESSLNRIVKAQPEPYILEKIGKKIGKTIERCSEPKVTIPLLLQTPEFTSAWESWIADRRQRRKPVTDKAANLQLKKLENIGVERGIAAINASIMHGWTGIYEERLNGASVAQPVSTQPKDYSDRRDDQW